MERYELRHAFQYMRSQLKDTLPEDTLMKISMTIRGAGVEMDVSFEVPYSCFPDSEEWKTIGISKDKRDAKV